MAGKVQRTATGQSYMEPLGFVQITSLSAAAGLGTVPEGATLAMIQPITQNISWRDDGTNPTAAIGMVLVVNDILFYSGTFSAIKLIEIAASAKVNITYYR